MSNDEWDEAAFKCAREDADHHYPLPKDTPGLAAAKFGLNAFLVVLAIELLLPILGLWWAGVLTIALSALIGWSDTNGRFKAHGRELKAQYEFHRRRLRK